MNEYKSNDWDARYPAQYLALRLSQFRFHPITELCREEFVEEPSWELDIADNAASAERVSHSFTVVDTIPEWVNEEFKMVQFVSMMEALDLSHVVQLYWRMPTGCDECEIMRRSTASFARLSNVKILELCTWDHHSLEILTPVSNPALNRPERTFFPHLEELILHYYEEGRSIPLDVEKVIEALSDRHRRGFGIATIRVISQQHESEAISLQNRIREALTKVDVIQ